MEKAKRKEMTAQWKERHPKMGIVSVKCLATGEEFYEISKDISVWFNRHLFELNAGVHGNKRLQELWKKYGEDGFERSVVSEYKYENIDDVKSGELSELLGLCLSENPNAKKIR